MTDNYVFERIRINTAFCTRRVENPKLFKIIRTRPDPPDEQATGKVIRIRKRYIKKKVLTDCIVAAAAGGPHRPAPGPEKVVQVKLTRIPAIN